ncbi:MAG: cohesin domain-containing protein [Candidatus Nealsonbacteria bacterium]
MNKISITILAVLISFLAVSGVRAEGASLYLSPSTGTYLLGSTFNVSVFVNTGGENINAVRADLKFDSRKIQVASPTAGKSFISVWLSQPSYSNIQGSISLQGGVPSPGINTSDGLVSTITFRAVAPGETIISILDSSRVLLDDGKGTDALSSVTSGLYTVAIPPPAGPAVFSSTHSDQNKWYKNNSPSLNWEKESGVIGFSYLIDQEFHTLPDNISEGSHTSVSYVDLADGIWYFHIKAQKTSGWGGTTHYPIQIDTTPPAYFSLLFEPTLATPVVTSKEPIVSFITTDGLSGIDHFEIKTVDLRKNLQASLSEFFVEVSSPYKIPSLDPGEHEVVVRAYDEAKNFQEVSEKINVIPIDKPFYLTKQGINIWVVFINWWMLSLVLILLIALLFLLIFRWQKKYRSIDQRVKNLKKAKEETEKMKEELKNKLNQFKENEK